MKGAGMAVDDDALKLKLHEWTKQQRKDSFKYMVMGGVSLAVFLLIWQTAVETGLANEKTLPAPITVLKTFLTKWIDHNPDGNKLGINILASLQVALSGFFSPLS